MADKKVFDREPNRMASDDGRFLKTVIGGYRASPASAA